MIPQLAMRSSIFPSPYTLSKFALRDKFDLQIPTQNIYEDKFGIFATRDAVTFYQNNRLYFYNASGEE